MHPLTSKQSAAWALFQKGESVIEISKRMKTSRQYVHQTLKIAEVKVSKTLLDVAHSNFLDIKVLQPERGILLGYNRFLRRNVIVTYTVNYGIRVWYWYDNPEAVKDEKLLEEAKRYLLNEAEERGVDLTADERSAHPAKLARTLFGKLLPEMKT